MLIYKDIVSGEYLPDLRVQRRPQIHAGYGKIPGLFADPPSPIELRRPAGLEPTQRTVGAVPHVQNRNSCSFASRTCRKTLLWRHSASFGGFGSRMGLFERCHPRQPGQAGGTVGPTASRLSTESATEFNGRLHRVVTALPLRLCRRTLQPTMEWNGQ